MRRGTIVTVAPPGSYGKPRPALVIQSDLISEIFIESIALCLMSSHLEPIESIRMVIHPDSRNGLKVPTQIMIDKLFTTPREKIGSVIGSLTPIQMREFDRKFAVFTGLA